jgi:hypothetical protein
MSIRLPLTTVLNAQNNGLLGVASTNGGIANTFLIPQDADNIVVKFMASTAGAGVSTVLQTSDDGGTNWYDVARTSIVSNSVGQNAEWLSIPVIGIGAKTTVLNVTVTSSIITPDSVFSTSGSGSASIYQGIGKATSVAAGGVTGLPILGRNARTFMIVGAAVTGVCSVTTQVMVNSQSAGT